MSALLWSLSLLSAHAQSLEQRLMDLSLAQDHTLQLESLVEDASVLDAELHGLLEHDHWRVRHSAATLIGWRTEEGVWSEWMIAQPSIARNGVPRFTGSWRGASSSAPPLLERYLHGGDDLLTRRALVEGLAHTGGDWSEAVVELLTLEPEPEVREMMAAVLRDADPVPARAGLRLAMQDDSAEVRMAAAGAAGWREDGELLAAELITLLQDPSPQVRSSAARSAGWRSLTAASHQLEALLQDPEGEVRLHALRALSRVAPQSLHPALLRPLQADADPRVARLALRLEEAL